MTLPVRRPVCKTGSTGSTPDQASTPSTVAFAGGRWLSNRPSYRRPARFDTGACDRNDSRLEETQPATAAARRKNIRSPGGPTVPATNRSRGSKAYTWWALDPIRSDATRIAQHPLPVRVAGWLGHVPGGVGFDGLDQVLRGRPLG
jgi:hypothetical protein